MTPEEQAARIAQMVGDGMDQQTAYDIVTTADRGRDLGRRVDTNSGRIVPQKDGGK